MRTASTKIFRVNKEFTAVFRVNSLHEDISCEQRVHRGISCEQRVHRGISCGILWEQRPRRYFVGIGEKDPTDTFFYIFF